ncbi:unnamed protein product [Orchesella dallaii]|uniref:Haloacid dehalogenase-like hydrolase domain-containing protein 2 n=1 Tax=Orchesella dallaii TaxID=48710 RepID=A0ABP1RS39_9HEXA
MAYSNKDGMRICRIPQLERKPEEYLSHATLKEFDRNSIRCFFINLGTTHIGNKLIPGATRAYAKMKMFRKIKIKYLSGSSSESFSTTLKKLTKMGFGILKEELYTATLSTRDYLMSRGLLRPYLVVSDDALQDFIRMDISSPNPNAVVIGYAPEKFNYETFNDCFRKIKNSQAKLVAIEKGRLRETPQRWCLENEEEDEQASVININMLRAKRTVAHLNANIEDGNLEPKIGKINMVRGRNKSIVSKKRCKKYGEDDVYADEEPDVGAGPFIEGLIYACREDNAKYGPIPVVGKPSSVFYRNAMFSLGQKYPLKCVMIGDDVDNDVIAAIESGMQACLVKTGKYRPGDEDKLIPCDDIGNMIPVKQRCLVVDTVEEAVEILLNDEYYDELVATEPVPTLEIWGRPFEYQTEMEATFIREYEKSKKKEKKTQVEKVPVKQRMTVLGYKI